MLPVLGHTQATHTSQPSRANHPSNLPVGWSLTAYSRIVSWPTTREEPMKPTGCSYTPRNTSWMYLDCYHRNDAGHTTHLEPSRQSAIRQRPVCTTKHEQASPR